MPKQPPSNRAYIKVMLNYGLMNIPVEVYSGTYSDHGISRKQFVSVTKGEGENATTEDHPVGNKQYDKITGEDVDYGQIIKKIETEYGEVYVEDNEIENLFGLTANVLEIKAFQPLHLFRQGAYVPKSLYYLTAQKGKKGTKSIPSPENQAAVAAVLKAMREEGAMCVCELTSRGKPVPAVLLPDGSLWTVYHTDALREQREEPEIVPADGDVDQVRGLIQALWTDDEIDLTDERSALIQEFADNKAREGDFGKPEVTAPVTPKANTNLLGALAASVEIAKAERAAAQAKAV